MKSLEKGTPANSNLEAKRKEDITRAIKTLKENGDRIDLHSVKEELYRMNGENYGGTSIFSGVPTTWPKEWSKEKIEEHQHREMEEGDPDQKIIKEMDDLYPNSLIESFLKNA